MWYIAFTLGLFGSLHCIGMCGPLAIAFTNKTHSSKVGELYTALSYNFGKTLTYIAIGLLFGIVGSLITINNLQSIFSIILGSILVISFLFSIDIERSINKSNLLDKYYNKVRQLLTNMMAKAKHYPTFLLGMANGLLPCGLVYLAIAGSLSTGSLLGGALFMLFFGIGTMPAMIALIIGSKSVPFIWRKNFKSVLSYITLLFGGFLIYRGFMVETPMTMDFWTLMIGGKVCG